MKKNLSIFCDVRGCTYNENGQNCKLECIKVTCGKGASCTCCSDYCEKQ